MRFLNLSLLLSGVVGVSACIHRAPIVSIDEAPAVTPAMAADPIALAPAIAPVEARAPEEPQPEHEQEQESAATVAQMADTARPSRAQISGEASDSDTEEEASPDDGSEEESAEISSNEPAPNGPLYSADLSDEELAQKWKEDLASLGSISVGFVHEGRLINAEQFPPSPADDWKVVDPGYTWATRETIDYVAAAIRKVRSQYPKAPPLRVNQISSREGGHLRPHKSHQNGRDVDLGFYYPTAEPIRVREREKYIDVALNWALVKALITETDVHMVLTDRRIIAVLYQYALEAGENKQWLDSVFHAGANSLIRHARGHRDHFHVRFYNPRAQELGRRIVPLLAQRPEQNIVMYRVRKGDTLGAIAVRYNTTVKVLQNANHLRGSFLRLGQVLKVQLRGPCTRCPMPPPVVVPKRRLPPAPVVADLSTPRAG